MTDIMLQAGSLIITEDAPTQAITSYSNLNVEDGDSSVVLWRNPDKFVITDRTKQFAVTNYNKIVFPQQNDNGIEDAPYNFNTYVRKHGEWVEFNYTNYPVPQDSYLYEQVDELNEFRYTALGLGIDPEDRFVSVNELKDLHIVQDNPGGGGGLITVSPPYMLVPPAPVNFRLIVRWESIDLSWTAGNAQYVNHSYTEIYRSIFNDVTSAVIINHSYNANYVDNTVTQGIQYFYWIRHVSIDGIKSAFNSPIGLSGTLSNDPSKMLDILTGEIRDSQLHVSLSTPIGQIPYLQDQVVINADAITAEALARADAINAEATARALAIEAEAIARGTAIDEATAILQTEDMNLATRIEFVTSVSNATFDNAKLWQFDTSVEGWTSNAGSPTVSSGYLRPYFSTATYVTSPSFTADGNTYPEVRLRIRRVGNPIWHGVIQYTTTLVTGFSSAYQIEIPEPVFFAEAATIFCDMSQALDWDTSVITQLRIQASLISDASNYFEFDWISIGRSGPGASIAAIVEEQTARTTADEAEALARTTLATQLRGSYTGSDIDAVTSGLIYEERLARVTEDNALALQISSISVGTNTQFDGSKMWYFDNGVEGWTQGSIVTPSWIRCNAGGYLSTTLGTAIGGPPNPKGNVNTQIRFRIRKIGTPTWVGNIQYIILGDAFNYVMNIPTEPTFESDGTASVTLNAYGAWVTANELGSILLNLYTTSSGNTYELDWFAVGRPAPGASTASVIQEQQARISADNALASDITVLEAQMLNKAEASAVTALQTEVTEIDGQVTAQASDITTLKATTANGGNLIPTDTEFTGTGITPWVVTGDGPMSGGKNFGGMTIDGVNCLGVRSTSSTPSTSSYFYIYHPNIPVVEGKRYCFSAYTASQSADVALVIQWFTAVSGGTSISSFAVLAPASSGGANLSTWARPAVFAVAPATAKAARIYMRFNRRTSQNDPYAWIARPSFNQVSDVLTAVPEYSAGGVPGAFAAVQTEASVRASETGPLMAQWSVKTTVGSLVGGVGFYNDGSITRFAIHADQFYVYSPGKNTFTLVVDGSNLAVPGGKIQTRTIVTDRIQIGAVTATVDAGGGITAMTVTTGAGASISSYNSAFLTRSYVGSTLIANAIVNVRFRTRTTMAAGYYRVGISSQGLYMINQFSANMGAFANQNGTTLTMYLVPNTYYGLPSFSLLASLLSSISGSYTGSVTLQLANLSITISHQNTGLSVDGIIDVAEFQMYSIFQELKV